MDKRINQPTARKRKTNSTLLGIIFTLTGALVFYMWGWPQFKYAYESKKWPQTSGIITQSKVNSWIKEGDSKYEARINYNYEIDGKKYNSGKIRTSGSYSGSNITRAKELVNEFPIGKNVDVFYDPEVPDSAILKPGVSGIDIIMVLFPLLFFIIGIAVLTGIIKPQPTYTNNYTRSRKNIAQGIRDILNK